MSITKRNSKDTSAKKANILVIGKSGVGKTTLVRTLPLKKTVLINVRGFEDGDISISDLDLDVWDVERMEDLEELLTELEKSPYEIVYFDSITALSKLSLEYHKKLFPNRTGGNVFDMWRSHAELMADVFMRFKKMDKHVIFTGLVSVDKAPAGSEVFSVSLDGKAFGADLPGFLDAVLGLAVTEEGKRALITSPGTSYACKVRVPTSTKIDPIVVDEDKVNLSYILSLMGFDIGSTPTKPKTK